MIDIDYHKPDKDRPLRLIRCPQSPAAASLVTILVIMTTVASFLLPAQASSGVLQATTITLSPSPATINGCETIQVQVWINEVTSLYGADVRLSFDPSVLEVVDYDPGTPSTIELEPGGFLQSPLYTILNSADNTAGTIEYAVTQLNPTPAVDGSGVLFIIRFRAKAEASSSPLHFTYTKLSNRSGEEILVAPSDGTASTVPATNPTLSIAKLDSTTATLSWTPSSGATEYHLYRDTLPYFAPSTPHVTTAGLSYDDVGALGDPDINHYYVVRAACATGFESGNSNRVGEFDFALVPGDSPGNYKYNFIALPLQVPTIVDANSLANYVGGVYMVIRYNAATQDVTYWLPDYGSGTNFPTTVGGPYFLYLKNTAPTNVQFVGNVPAQESVVFSLVRSSAVGSYRYNALSIPLDKSEITTADQLAQDISGVYMAIRYDAQTQGLTYWLPDYGSGTNFAVRIGYPYFAYLKSTGPVVWPNYP